MARARAKAGGRARQAPHRGPGRGSNAKGKPQQSQEGPSRKVMPLQQVGQNPRPAPKGSPQPIQSGGNRKSSSPVFTFRPMIFKIARFPSNARLFLTSAPHTRPA